MNENIIRYDTTEHESAVAQNNLYDCNAPASNINLTGTAVYNPNSWEVENNPITNIPYIPYIPYMQSFHGSSFLTIEQEVKLRFIAMLLEKKIGNSKEERIAICEEYKNYILGWEWK